MTSPLSLGAQVCALSFIWPFVVLRAWFITQVKPFLTSSLPAPKSGSGVPVLCQCIGLTAPFTALTPVTEQGVVSVLQIFPWAGWERQ